jgi:hypothetical protein
VENIIFVNKSLLYFLSLKEKKITAPKISLKAFGLLEIFGPDFYELKGS